MATTLFTAPEWEFAEIPAGEFMIGALPGDDEGYSTAKPVWQKNEAHCKSRHMISWNREWMAISDDAPWWKATQIRRPGASCRKRVASNPHQRRNRVRQPSDSNTSMCRPIVPGTRFRQWFGSLRWMRL